MRTWALLVAPHEQSIRGGSPMTRILASITQRLRQRLDYLAALFAIEPHGTYRPEAHYMRGPGPKWRAKHAQPER